MMQFQPSEYEALFKDVIEPVCKAEGLQAYRSDSTYMPGLVIEDIKRADRRVSGCHSRGYARQPKRLLRSRLRGRAE
jgi:hypothetical protein